MEHFIIKDTRSLKDFGTNTFSGYKKTDVIQELKKKIMNCDKQNAFLWAFELLGCGEIQKIYDTLFFIIFKKIGIENPRLPHRFYRRYKFMIALREHYVSQYSQNQKNKSTKWVDLELRNQTSLRNHICELITICCESKKEPAPSCIKIKRNEFSGAFIKTKAKADTNDYIYGLRRRNDSNEVILAMNEIGYALKEKNETHAFFWISWILEWDFLLLKNGSKLLCGDRYHIYARDEANDVVWFIWEVLLKNSENLDKDVRLQIHSCFQLYKYDWTPGKKRSKSHLMLLCVEYIIKMYSMRHETIGKLKHILKESANSFFHIETLKKHEIVEMNSSLWKLNSVKTRDKLIPSEKEKQMTSKQREKKTREKLIKSSEEKIWTVYKLDKQMN